MKSDEKEVGHYNPGSVASLLFPRLKKIGIALAIVLFLSGTVFTVNPTDRANLRRFGVVQYSRPLGSGLHFKLPLIDTVDKLQVSLTTLKIPAFEVTTVDNQKVTLEMNFNYTTPDDKVNHVLYEIGRAGNTDIEDQVVAVAKDRAARIFAGQNMVTVNANRLSIQEAMEKSISTSVRDLFGIEPHSLQIVAITPSPAFMESNENAVKAKNDAVAAENTKRTIQFQADQKVIAATGDADSSIQAARGRAESVRLEAEATKTKLTLEGEGQASNLEAQIKPFGTPDKYIQYLQAKAALNWNGQTPQIVAGSGSGTNLVIPVPTPAYGGGAGGSRAAQERSE
jgi:regulator of protease activity HflC (stomatin/prohibitin superfamily)